MRPEGLMGCVATLAIVWSCQLGMSAYLARTQPALQHQQEHSAIPPSMNPLHEHLNFCRRRAPWQQLERLHPNRSSYGPLAAPEPHERWVCVGHTGTVVTRHFHDGVLDRRPLTSEDQILIERGDRRNDVVDRRRRKPWRRLPVAGHNDWRVS